MKKALLLSVVASGIIYAGGDIAPAEPVQQPAAAPAACNFWGTLAFRYDGMKNESFKDANNDGVNDNKNKWDLDSVPVAAIAMGVEKELGYGFGIGAELDGVYALDGKFNKNFERGEIMQAYLNYKAGNTKITVGRQALPKAVSPWAFTERDTLGGVPARTFNGVTVVNKDLPNTTLVAAWVASVYDFNKGNVKLTGNTDKGLYALGAIYTGFENTTLSGIVYYIPKEGSAGKAISAWAAIESKIQSVNVGLQLAYTKADLGSLANISNNSNNPDDKATFGVAGYIGTQFDAFDVKLTLAYINDGDGSLSLSQSTMANVLGEATSGFWGASYRTMGGNASLSAGKQKIARLDVGYKLPENYGKIYAGVAMDDPDNGKTAYAARVGYDFTVYGVNAKIEYRYHKDFAGNKDQRIRVQGVYKF